MIDFDKNISRGIELDTIEVKILKTIEYETKMNKY